MKKLINLFFILFSAAFLFSGCQQGGEEESESFKKYGQEFEGKIAKSYEDSEEWWPTPTKPPEGTPNVVILLLDDTGFGHLSSFGGLVETPHIDKLADDGVRYNILTKILHNLQTCNDNSLTSSISNTMTFIVLMSFQNSATPHTPSS